MPTPTGFTSIYTSTEIDAAIGAVSGKAEKSEMSVVAGTGSDADKTTITLKTGTSATVLTSHQDISGKADVSTAITSVSRSGDMLRKTINGTTTDVTHILERNGTYFHQNISSSGWYRIGQFLNKPANGAACLLLLSRSYANTTNEGYIFAITLSYNGGISISQISGKYNTQFIDKIRVEYKTNNDDFLPYIDMHVSGNTSNAYRVTIVGGASALDTVELNPTLVGTTMEYSVHNGIGCNNGIATSGNITATGNVGVGVSSPLYKLDVDGTLNATGAATLGSTLGVTGDTTIGGGVYLSNGKYVYGKSTGNVDMALVGTSSSNNVLVASGSVTASSNTYIMGGSSVTFRVGGSTSSDNTMTLNSSRNVGIGTNSPSCKLDVAGDVAISGSLSLGGTPVVKVFSGSSAPSSSTGSNGDIYIQTS